jgi:hypothetical protein
MGELAPDVTEWVARAQPLRPWIVCPLGLHHFVAPVLAENPYLEAIELCDVLDPDATAGKVRSLVAGEGRAARDGYRARVAALPTGYERLLELI